MKYIVIALCVLAAYTILVIGWQRFMNTVDPQEKKSEDDDEADLTPEELAIHREEQAYLRCLMNDEKFMESISKKP